MNVEALAITDDAYNAAWSFGSPVYSQLSQMLSPDAAPFGARLPHVPGQRDFRGILLHWALPDGLTLGAESEGEVIYPAVPDRWLVLGRARVRDQWRTSAWIVAVDVLGDAAGGPWPPPRFGDRPTTLGASWPIQEWPGEAALAGRLVEPPLTAVGPGDPTYAAFAPNVPNAFSFADPFTVDDERAGPLTYTVLGWYSRPERDPLYGAQYGPDGWRDPEDWREVAGRLGWSVGDEAALAEAEQAAREWALARGLPTGPDPHLRLPARTLCHGTVQGIAWEGTSAPFISGVPDQQADRPGAARPRVAIAHSGPEALAAMLAEARREQGMNPDRIAQLVDILTAFQLNLLPVLDEPDGAARLDEALQRAWFTPVEGGTAWEVLARQDAEAPSGDPVPPELTDRQRELLDELNARQDDLDERTWTLQSLQWDLFALWWKQARLQRWFPPPPDDLKTAWFEAIASSTAAIEAELENAEEEHGRLTRCRDAARTALTASLDDHLELRADANPPFQAPSEPVLMISGARRARRHGEDGRLTEDGTLRCRFTGQTVNGLMVPVNGRGVPVTGTDLPPPSWPVSELPPETADLLLEAALLDLGEAPRIAVTAADKVDLAEPWTLLPVIRAGQSEAWDPGRDSMLLFGPGPGAVPSQIAVSRHTPPWAPLFMDWAFEYYPGSERQSAVLEPWELPGTESDPLDEFTYRWRGPAVPERKHPQLITGRSALTPQVAESAAARLEQLIDDYGDEPEVADRLWALTDALGYLREADLLSQAVGGFNAALIERAEETFPLAADAALARYLDPVGGPELLPATPPNPPRAVPPVIPNPFQPVRAGHVRITRLWVVDAFGQVLKIVDPLGGLPPPNPPPIRSADLYTRGDDWLAELKPRITQPSRLQLRLVSAERAEPGESARPEGDPVAAGAAPVVPNPVCGWILPGVRERAVHVYAADGQFEGSILDAYDRAVWAGPPERTVPADGSSPDTISNVHLRRMITGLLDHADSAGALRALIGLIETAAWGTVPSGCWADQELPVLLGAPMCVVRSRLRLGLRGLPAQDQDWNATGRGNTEGFDSVRFPVQLGSTELLDDGLVGYYLDDDYRRINSVYPVSADGYVGSARPAVSLDGSAAPFLTLVMSPMTAVHAISGILPVERVRLPVVHTVPALGRMAITIRTGPVLSGPGEVVMPLPEVSHGSWSWLEHLSPLQVAVASPVTGADPVAALPDAPPVLREGWLRLSAAAGPGALAMSVSPSTVATTSDLARPGVLTLQFTAYNPADVPVDCFSVGFSLPSGGGETELTSDPDTVVVIPPSEGDWTVERAGPARFTLRPCVPPLRVRPGDTLVFKCKGVLVNAVPGRAAVEMRQTVAPAMVVPPHGPDEAGEQRCTVAVTKIPPVAPTRLVYTIVRLEGSEPGRTGELFQITAFNGSVAAVDCAQITVTVPVGDGPGDLVREPAQVSARITEDDEYWRIDPDGTGGFVLRPRYEGALAPASGSAVPPGARIVAELRVESMVGSAGTAVLAVLETTAGETVNRATVLTIRKHAAHRSGAADPLEPAKIT